MRVVRTVALCLETAQIAEEMENFSLFVRTQLALHAGTEDALHTMAKAKRLNHGYRISQTHLLCNPYTEKWRDYVVQIETNRCDPYDKKRQCLVCWPLEDGPLEEQITAMVEQDILSTFHHEKDIQDREEE